MKNKKEKKLRHNQEILQILQVLFCLSFSPTSHSKTPIPKGFVYLKNVDPTITQDIRYHGSNNFLGRPVAGYLAAECLLSEQAAQALKKIQQDLRPFDLSLKVYDCYRPQWAVDDFVTWAKDLKDDKMKKIFYPQVEKTQLFKDGYIAEKSGHSRGSTVDITLIPLKDAKTKYPLTADDQSLDFGTRYDFFDPLSHTENHNIEGHQKIHRLLLKTLMEKHGFKHLPEEWWHFTLVDEPFPNQYFDFQID